MTIAKKSGAERQVKEKKTKLIGLDKTAIAAALADVGERLAAHGGGVELIKVGQDSVTVRLTGGCIGCPMAQITLKNGVEKLLKERVPGLKTVESAE